MMVPGRGWGSQLARPSPDPICLPFGPASHAGAAFPIPPALVVETRFSCGREVWGWIEGGSVFAVSLCNLTAASSLLPGYENTSYPGTGVVYRLDFARYF